MTDPFRSELEAAHQRIEKLEAEHKARVGELEAENARLRKRLTDTSSEQRRTGRTFASLGIMILAVSLAVGIVVARVAGRPEVPKAPASVAVIELPSARATVDFDRAAAESALDHVKLDDCATSHTEGHVQIVFAPSGAVSTALVDRGISPDSSIAHCVEDRYRAVRVPPFSGSPVTVGRAFTIP